MAEVTVVVSGPVGSGKTAIIGIIKNALQNAGVHCRVADEVMFLSEVNTTGGDWERQLTVTQPNALLIERIDRGVGD